MGQVRVGTASWTDRTLIESGWYPPEANNPEKRLRYYARQFPLVEVGATYYALPAEQTARTGARGVPPGLRAAGRAGPGLPRIPQPDLDDRGQPARDPGLSRLAPAPVRVRGHAAGLPEFDPAGAGRNERPGRGPDARALGQ